VAEELIARAEHLVERLSSLDRNLTLMTEELRADNRQMRQWIFGLYAMIIAVAGVGMAVIKL
jgi:hypothetical protein